MKLPVSKRVWSGAIKDLANVCKKYSSGFTGGITILSAISGRLYQSNVLVSNGYVFAASHESIDGRISLKREDALKAIADSLAKGIGHVTIYEYDKSVFDDVLAKNPEFKFPRELSMDFFLRVLSGEEVKPEVEKPEVKPEELEFDTESLRKELEKLELEWKKLEKEWKKIGLKEELLSVEEEKEKEKKEDESREEKAKEDTKEEKDESDESVLSYKPTLKGPIKFTDKIRLLAYPGAFDVIKLMDGNHTVKEISTSLGKKPEDIIKLVSELRKSGYIAD